MSKLVWGAKGKKTYETGTSHGVLYVPNLAQNGDYDKGYAWNGLTTVSQSPSGAESNKQYADNGVYLNMISAEEFAATIEAFTYPAEFEPFMGFQEPEPGLLIGQQDRGSFGFSYRSILGNDLQKNKFAYKLHLIYGATAAPTEKSHATVNESPEAANLSWELSTEPVAVKDMSPTAILTINSSRADADALAELEAILYGKDETTDGAGDSVMPRLPLPDEVIEIFSSVV